ncbi:hypothetical protein [Labrys neptuniae]
MMQLHCHRKLPKQSFPVGLMGGSRRETLQMFDILQILLDRAHGSIKKNLLGRHAGKVDRWYYLNVERSGETLFRAAQPLLEKKSK